MTKKLNMLKLLMFAAMFCFCLGLNTGVVNAKDVSEKEPNNDFESAQEIEANETTPESTLDGSSVDKQYTIEGQAKDGEEDWYKVYLTNGKQYVTINGEACDIELYDSEKNFINSWSYSKIAAGWTGYTFQAKTGYYYVRIIGTTISSERYFLRVGDPIYILKYHTVNLPSVTMTYNNKSYSRFNLSNVSGLPEDAFVYGVRVSNVKSTQADWISLTNEKNGFTTRFDIYPWQNVELIGAKMPLKSEWTVTYAYERDATFTPSITLNYIYPQTQ